MNQIIKKVFVNKSNSTFHFLAAHMFQSHLHKIKVFGIFESDQTNPVHYEVRANSFIHDIHYFPFCWTFPVMRLIL